jgi:hypothetical protein
MIVNISKSVNRQRKYEVYYFDRLVSECKGGLPLSALYLRCLWSDHFVLVSMFFIRNDRISFGIFLKILLVSITYGMLLIRKDDA